MYCGVHGAANEPLIVILWVQRMHFEPVGACRGVLPDKTAIQFVFDPEKDTNIVDHIMNNYGGQCSV
jgi:hypothetical protein